MTGRRPGVDERRVSAIIGLIFLVVTVAATVLAVEWRSGRFDDDYELVATFDGVGQFFRTGSEVNVRGVTVGEITAIDLRPDNRARVRMSIGAEHRIPATATAIIRGKSLLGPKYLDLAFDPLSGDVPLLADGDRIDDTVAATELEPVLTELHDFLEAVDPRELAVVFGSLARASRDQGEVFGRVIDDGAEVLDVLDTHSPAMRAALADFALLSEELAAHGGDMASITDRLNEVFPVLNRRGDELAGVLDSTASLSADIAALMDANVETIDVLVGNGDRILGILEPRNARVAPTVYSIAKLLIGFNEIVSLPVGNAGIAYRDELVFPPTICELFVSGNEFEEPQIGPYTGEGHCASTPSDDGDGQVVGGPAPVPSIDDVLDQVVPDPVIDALPDVPDPPDPPDELDEILDLLGGGRR